MTTLPTAPRATRYRLQDRGARVAAAVTDLLSPAHLVVALLLLVGVASSPSPLAGLAWGLLAATFAGLLPYMFIALGVRRGRYSGRHIPHREQRVVPLLVAVGCVVSGGALLGALGAPRQLFALLVAMLVGLVVTLSITSFWKISIHAAVAGGAASIAVVVLGPPALLAGSGAVAAVGWSRVHLGDHTRAQVAAGAVLGAVVAATVFPPLRA